MLLSFIVPAHNEEAEIGTALHALHAAARDAGVDYEVIVVDDASTDRTAAIAADLGARVVASTKRQIAGARNVGAQAAQGDVLVFVDADTHANADAVRAIVQAVRQGAVGGGARPRFDEPIPWYARLITPVFLFVYSGLGLAAGCFFFAQRDHFRAVGGFDERFYAAEEVALSRALARRGRFVVLRERVLTSGRKLRTHTGRELLRMLTRGLAAGRRVVHSRTGLELWYGERRKDPRSTA